MQGVGAEATIPGSWSFGAGALRLEAVSPSGSWAAYCTSRDPSQSPTLDARGSALGALDVYLATPRGERGIDALLAVDPSGRFVVTLEPGGGPSAESTPVLVDTATDRRFSLTQLSPDLRSDGLSEHRSFAFSRSGAELFVLQKEGQGVLLSLTVNDNPLAHVTNVTLSSDAAYRVEASADSFVILTVPAARAPAKWPSAQTKNAPLRCQSRALSAYAALSGPLPDPSIGYLLVSPKEPRATALRAAPAPGFVQGFQGGWVRRTEQGELLLVSNGQQKRIASSRCGARILEADEKSGWFLIACEEYRPVKPAPAKVKPGRKPPAPKLRFPLYLARPGGLRDLELETMRTGVDAPSRSAPRIVALHVDGRPVLVDLERGTKQDLGASQRILTTFGQRALVRDGERLSLEGGGEPLRLEARAPALSRLLLGPNSATFDELLIHATTQSVESRALSAAPLALTASHVFVPQKAETDGAWAKGPVVIQPLDSASVVRAPRPADVDLEEELDRPEADIGRP